LKTYVLYDDDNDGFTAAFAAFLKLGADGVAFIPVNRGDEPPTMPDAERIFVLDFNYSRPVMEEMKNKANEVVLLDHHHSAAKELSGLPYCHFDLAKSAAAIAWEYFFPKQPLPFFFAYVQDADLWKFQLPYSREVRAALDSYARTLETWQNISGIVPQRCAEREVACITKLFDDGESCLRYCDRRVAEMLNNTRWAIFPNDAKTPAVRFASEPDGDNAVPVVNASVLQSEICHALLSAYPNVKFAACYYDGGDNFRHWNLRSSGETNVSDIAERFGGGGHHHAAGFRTAQPSDKGKPEPVPDSAAQ
jgi:uncharacterized protein